MVTVLLQLTLDYLEVAANGRLWSTFLLRQAWTGHNVIICPRVIVIIGRVSWQVTLFPLKWIITLVINFNVTFLVILTFLTPLILPLIGNWNLIHLFALIDCNGQHWPSIYYVISGAHDACSIVTLFLGVLLPHIPVSNYRHQGLVVFSLRILRHVRW